MRGKAAPKRKIQGDVKYNDADIAKFINYFMVKAKKPSPREWSFMVLLI